jgi:hypothetical protein
MQAADPGETCRTQILQQGIEEVESYLTGWRRDASSVLIDAKIELALVSCAARFLPVPSENPP